MASRSLGYRAPLLWVVLPYITGLSLAKSGLEISLFACLTGAVCTVAIAAWAAGRNTVIWGVFLALSISLAGVASYTLNRARLTDWENLPPREANLTLRITRTFSDSYPNRAAGMGRIIDTDAHLADLRGQRIYYSLRISSNSPTPIASAEINTLGILKLLAETPEHNSFDGYLADAGINFRYTHGQIINESRPASAFRLFCDRTADRFSTILTQGVEEKRPMLSKILPAMLLGRKSDLSEQQDTLFMQSGTMHLFAISGLHIGVIALGLHALLSLARLPRAVRFVLSLVALWLYVNITGNTPSAVRAFTMVALFQASFLLRVPGNPFSALTASALLVLCFDPLQLFSASFQMSYGIVTALLLLGLPLAEGLMQRWPLFTHLPKFGWTWWQRGINHGWRVFLGALGIGLASILFSMIVGVQYFGLLTPGALLANLILIPIASFVILAGMGSLLCGLVGFTAGSILCNHAAVLVLWVIETAIRSFVTWPGVYHLASFKASWIGPVALTGLLASILFGYAHRWSARSGGWWPPFIIVLLTLIFGVNFA